MNKAKHLGSLKEKAGRVIVFKLIRRNS